MVSLIEKYEYLWNHSHITPLELAKDLGENTKKLYEKCTFWPPFAYGAYLQFSNEEVLLINILYKHYKQNNIL